MIRLVRANLALMDAALAGDEELARALGHSVVPGWVTFAEALRAIRAGLDADPASADWGSRLFVSCEPEELVGWGGFKGPPQDGVLELGYEIAESRRGRGLATATTLALLDEAFAEPQVVKVIAHTLVERNTSNRVLEKAGFRFDREAQERDQPVWRFALDRPAAAQG